MDTLGKDPQLLAYPITSGGHRVPVARAGNTFSVIVKYTSIVVTSRCKITERTSSFQSEIDWPFSHLPPLPPPHLIPIGSL